MPRSNGHPDEETAETAAEYGAHLDTPRLLADYLGRVRGALTTPERIMVCGGLRKD